MKYKHLEYHERKIIGTLRRLNYSQAAIARELGRSTSTISRELKRNRRSVDGRYRASHAQSNYTARKRRARRGSRFDWGDWYIVEKLLRQDFSPEQVAGKLRGDDRLMISHESIYKHVWRNKKQGGDLYSRLRGAQKQRRKRYGKYDSRGRLAHKTMIDERPVEANERLVTGHWEVDTVHGTCKAGIMTIVDRRTGYVMIGQLDARTKKATNRRIIQMIRRCPERFITITSDNGSEFHGYRKIEEACDVKFYFARPYHSWERGTNENTNGLIRQYLPKGTSMKGLTQVECNAIARKLNNRPRKRLGYRTPNEVFNDISNIALHS